MHVYLPRIRRALSPALLSCLAAATALPVAAKPLVSTVLAAPYDRRADVTLTGRVVNAKGEPLPGVNVFIKGTQTAAQTDLDGRYTITAPEGATLVFSFVGYGTKEVVLTADQTSADVTLDEDSQLLQEAVVVGYLTQNRQNVSSAVASLDTKEASKQPGATVNQQLQGRIAGVQVDGSGSPGSVPNLVIRGVGTLLNGSEPLYVVDGLWTNTMIGINPADIQDVTVLKDASSTAVYGSRGANGVVIITTKRGRSGKTNITFSGYEGIETVNKQYDMMNGDQWRNAVRTAYQNGGRDLNYLTLTNTGLSGVVAATEDPNGTYNPATAANTDWQKEFFRSGAIRDYNATFSGGNQEGRNAGNYLLSVGYFNQEGVVKGPTFERYSARLNSGFTRGRFKLTESLALTHVNTRLLSGAPFIDVLGMLPLIPVSKPADASGSTWGYGSDSLKTFATNPIGYQNNRRVTQRNERLQGAVQGEFRFWDFLTYKLNVALEAHLFTDRVTEMRGNLRFNDGQRFGVVSENRGFQTFLMVENTLNFNKSFGNHNVAAVGGYSEQKYKFDNSFASIQGFTAPYFFQLGSSSGLSPTIQGGADVWAKRSWFGQATYDYANKYLVTFAARADGSSKFWDGNDRSRLYGGNGFYSGSLGWRISEEGFWKESVSFVNQLKLRASYGMNGNDAGGFNYLGQPAINPTIGYPLGASQAVLYNSIQTRIPNPLTWEMRYTTNFGVDFGLWDNRITGSVDYFIADTKDAIVTPAVPLYLGNFDGAVYTNGGTIRNQGLEVALGYHDRKGEFTYGADLTLTAQKNKLTSVPDSISYFPAADLPQVTRSFNGQPISAFYLVPMEGIFQTDAEAQAYQNADGLPIQPYAQAGDVKYRDVNGDGQITAADREFVGSYFPKLVFGLNLQAAYKGFDISVFLQGTRGSKIFNTARANIEANGINNYRADLTYWTPETPNTPTPRLLALDSDGPLATASAMNSMFQTTRWLESGDYLRLKNIQIGYTFPNSVTRALSIESLRLFVTARNLFTITPYSGYDPEIQNSIFQQGVDNTTYPNVRTFTGGLQFSF